MQEKFFFDDFEVDALKRTLLRGGRPVALNPKAFDLLLALVMRHGEVLSKQHLLDLVWKDQFVEEKNLTVHVAALRKALGETKNENRFIATVPGNGYKFVANVDGSGRRRTEPQAASEPGLPLQAATIDSPEPRRRARLRSVVAALVGLALVGLAVTAGYMWRSQRKSAFPAESKNITIRRLTSDGKATSAALSPDGKLFAYSHLDGEDQSLWLGHVDGGEPIQIRPPAPVIYLDFRFSPDANSLYYALTDDSGANGAVYKIPVFGGLSEKIEDKPYSIAFSPSGKQLAFVRPGSDASSPVLAVSDADGKNERQLANPPDNMKFARQASSWSPDGSMIAMGAYRSDTNTNYDIYTIAVADGSVTRLTSGAWSLIRTIAWLTDGSGLIVVGQSEASTQSQLWLVSFPDGEVRHLVSDLNAYGTAGTFAKDQSTLLTIQGQAQSNIWISPADNLAQAKQVTVSSIGKKVGWFGLKWTADGTIAYTADGGDNNTIWTMEPDGSGQKQLIPSEGNNIYPSVSADDRFIVFQSNRGGDYAVWRANRDGSDILKLTDKGIAAQPEISPDGRWVIYVSNPEGAGELWRMTISGGDPVKLADGASWPRISPDSRSIACGYLVEGKLKVAVLSIDGGSPTKVFELPRLANVRLGVHWTPDGGAVTYRDWANGIWRQDLAGGAPQRLKALPQEKLYAYDWSPDGKYFAFTRGIEIRDVVLISDFR